MLSSGITHILDKYKDIMINVTIIYYKYITK